ncbi:eotaxin-like [Oreochromis aureus]|uniref:Chemokine interleukin-8-like domain-containing protein n=1 Tax=Oreochromis aureus TaxID=47969 RepID=A0AAZ1Y1K3_OREAU|nr:eotaxin-like [Oreochromis aureus]
MSVKILSITLLLLSTCVCCHSSEDTHGRGPGSTPPCCVDITKDNKRGDVVGETYREQAARPPCVKAIIFNTKDGKQLCADPDAQWVKDLTAKMKKV